MKKTLIPTALATIIAATALNSQYAHSQPPKNMAHISAVNSLLMGPKPTFSAQEGGICEYTNKSRTIIAESGQTIKGNSSDRNATFTGESFPNAGYKTGEFTVNEAPAPFDQLYTGKDNALSCSFTPITYLILPSIDNALVTNNKNGNSFPLYGAGNIKDLLDVNLEGILYDIDLTPNINYENPSCTPGTTYNPRSQENLVCNATRKNISVDVGGTGTEGPVTINYDGNQYSLNPNTITQIPFTNDATLTFNQLNGSNYQIVGRNQDGSFILETGTQTNDSNRNVYLTQYPFGMTGNKIFTDDHTCVEVVSLFNPLAKVSGCNGQMVDLEGIAGYSSGSPVVVTPSSEFPYMVKDAVKHNGTPIPISPNIAMMNLGEAGYVRLNR